MVRILGIFAGLGFVAALLWAMVTTPLTIEENAVEEFHQEPRALHLASDGAFGKFDRVQLQRGMKVFKEVCSACHGLNQVAFRNFADFGYNEAQVKAIAAGWPVQTPSVNPETGEAATRAPLPSDHIPSPYPNAIAAAAANNNAVPPDLSLITKAREGGAPYVYSLLTGYRPVPANLPKDLRPAAATLHYNPWFANLNLAMPAPLTSEGQVTYDDGTKATVDQMAKDVSAFLVWAAEPKLEARHRAGWAALGFLLVFTTLTYLSYRTIWAEKKGH